MLLNFDFIFVLQYVLVPTVVFPCRRIGTIITGTSGTVTPIAPTWMATWNWRGCRTNTWIWVFYNTYEKLPDTFWLLMWTSTKSCCLGCKSFEAELNSNWPSRKKSFRYWSCYQKWTISNCQLWEVSVSIIFECMPFLIFITHIIHLFRYIGRQCGHDR